MHMMQYVGCLHIAKHTVKS